MILRLRETFRQLSSARFEVGGTCAGAPPHKTMRPFWVALVILIAAFAVPLYQLAEFAIGSELYSHILIVPLAAAYFFFTGNSVVFRSSGPSWSWSIVFILMGVLLALIGLNLGLSNSPARHVDYLSAMTASLLCFGYGASTFYLNRESLRRVLFPLGFLLFMIPLPAYLQSLLETFLQHGSALTAFGFFKIYGTPILVTDVLVFDLPGFRLHVAPECSGIHSSLVLFIVSVAASRLFLHTAWKRAALVLAVIPLALLRNGLRIFVVGQLCVDVGPQMIDSYIHRHGGPVFFVLSLIPLLLALIALYRTEQTLPHSGGGLPYKLP